jgi:hypothetical protein
MSVAGRLRWKSDALKVVMSRIWQAAPSDEIQRPASFLDGTIACGGNVVCG